MSKRSDDEIEQYKQNRKNKDYHKPEYWFDCWRNVLSVIRRKIIYRNAYLDESIRIARYSGCKFFTSLSLGIGRELIVYAGFEYKQLRWLHNQHKKHNVDMFLDIGANMGIYGIIAAKKWQIKHVHMFEPVKNTVKQLYANIYLNDLIHLVNQRHITIHEKAVYNENGTVDFFDNGYRQCERSHIKNDGEKIGKKRLYREPDLTTTIETVTIDTLFPHKNKTFMIKVDTEGSELQVLQGMENLLLNNKCILQVETFPNNRELVRDYLISLGFKLDKEYGPHGFMDFMMTNFK